MVVFKILHFTPDCLTHLKGMVFFFSFPFHCIVGWALIGAQCETQNKCCYRNDPTIAPQATSQASLSLQPSSLWNISTLVQGVCIALPASSPERLLSFLRIMQTMAPYSPDPPLQSPLTALSNSNTTFS